MAYKVNDTTVIDDTGNIQCDTGLTLNNDSGVISVQSTSPMVGTVAGYSSAGFPRASVIDRFPFATDTNATDVGDLTVARDGVSGNSSDTHGYIAAGGIGPAVGLNTIDKFSFAASTNANDVGNLTRTSFIGTRGQSSLTYGYTSQGRSNPGGGYSNQNTIDKFPFSADSNATDVGDLTEARQGGGSQSSSTSGYNSGGSNPVPVSSNVIDKFPFSTDTNATDVGDLFLSRQSAAGHSSTTHGYTVAGYNAGNVNTIDKFPFSTDTNASDVGDLTEAKTSPATQSSTSFGYSTGGSAPANVNTIDKYPFSSDSNATDVGDLSGVRTTHAGQQD